MARYLRANGAGGSLHEPVSLSRNLAPAQPAGMECLPECLLQGRNGPKTAATLAGGLLSNSRPGKTRTHSAKERPTEMWYSRRAGNRMYGEVPQATQLYETPRSEDAGLEIPPIADPGEERFCRRESTL